MLPIVNGLEEQFSTEMHFVYLNANTDGAGAFEALSLRGHPATVIFDAQGEEQFRALGVQEEAALRSAIESAIAEP